MKSANQSRLLLVLIWMLRIVAALFFFRAGFSKLAGAERQVALFNTIGWGDWFLYLTGATEIVGALLLLFPKIGAFGALLLFGVSGGALVTLVILKLSVLPALIALAWTGGLLFVMRDSIISLSRGWRGKPSVQD